jgi:membrane-associated phospholipid phosphatase
MIQSLLALDTELLISARGLVGPEYARLIQILWESVVIYWALMLICVWLFWVSRKDNAPKIWALQIFFTVIFTFFFYTVANFGIDKWRPSPGEVAWAIAPLIPHPLDNSFPSGHALFTAALIVGLFRFTRRKWLIAWTLIFGVITALARIIGWVHYPGDILWGWILGGIWAYIASIILDHAFFRNFIFAPIIKLASFFKL